MKVVDVHIDWSGRYGLVYEDGSIAWIKSAEGLIIRPQSYCGIELIDNTHISLNTFVYCTYKIDITNIESDPSWERGIVVHYNTPGSYIIPRAPGITIATCDGHCYVVENVDHVLIRHTDLHQINLSTGELLSPKLVPNCAHQLRFSESHFNESFRALRLMRFDRCEINTLGLLQITMPNMEVFYSELSLGEDILQDKSDCIVTTSHNNTFCIIIDSQGGFLMPFNSSCPQFGLNTLSTFYGICHSNDGEFALKNAKVTKCYTRLVVQWLGKKTKAALPSLEYD